MKKLMIVVMVIMLFCSCSQNNEQITDKEISAINDICGSDYSADELENVTENMLADGRNQKFQALKKAYKLPNGYYAFIAKPIGYNGEISMAIVINGDKTVAIRILEHVETDHYVRDFDTADWFVGRFKDKSVHEYLKVVRLNEKNDNEIVAITGSTITAQAVVNGVNSAFGAYTEAVLGGTADAVDYAVDSSEYERRGLGK